MRGIIASVALLAGVGAAPASAQIYDGAYGYNGNTIRCESSDGRTRECSVPGGRQVQLLRQLSRAACVEGSTWGYGRNGIWVSDGCRGEFQLYAGNQYGYGNQGSYGNDRYNGNQGSYGNDRYYGNQGNGYGNGYGNGQTIRCESRDTRAQRCALNANPRDVQLVRQLSRAACIEGRTWGYDRGGVWVSQGCRAEFSASGSGYGYGNRDRYGNTGYSGYGQGYGQLFRCESNDGRTRECAANVRAGVQLVRQLSNAACIQGRTWGYGRNGIWVSQGCRAEFRSH